MHDVGKMHPVHVVDKSASLRPSWTVSSCDTRFKLGKTLQAELLEKLLELAARGLAPEDGRHNPGNGAPQAGGGRPSSFRATSRASS
jgi:hypothetical protein